MQHVNASNKHCIQRPLSTSKDVLFPGHNHLLTTSADDPALSLSPERQRVIIKVKGHQHQWLVGGYDPEIAHF